MTFTTQTPDGVYEIVTSAPSGLIEGEWRKTKKLELLRARRWAIVRNAQRALLQRLLDAGTATADDVRAAVDLPDDIDPRCLGSVPGTLAHAGIIRHEGFVKSVRPERHASYIGVWLLADRTAAQDWLRFNPPIENPPVAADGFLV